MFQVPICSPDDIFKQFVWLPFCPHHCEMVHWFTSWFISHNDIHVLESHWWSGRKPAFHWSENWSGGLLLLLNGLFILGFFSTHIRCNHSTYSFYLFCYQIVLLLLALVAVPWMLLPKPFLMKKQHEEVVSAC